MSDPVNWGILGTGAIANRFATGLADVSGARLVAVGSRNRETADAFANRYGIERRHGSYGALAADPGVDVVYVSTPHPFHADNSLLLLQQGKAVLCEKPFTINAGQARAVIQEARQRKLFLMEAMWTRFLPAVVKTRELIAQGAIGEVVMVQADFGFRAPLDPQSRLFSKNLGGGALLDVGIYPLSLASMVLGFAPEAIESTAHIGETGVDEQSAILLRYSGGQIAVLCCALRTNTGIEATIMGSEGSIRLHSPFFRCPGLTVTRGDVRERIELPLKGNGYNYQAEEVCRCLRAGEKESMTMPLDETLALIQLMDRIRGQWGLNYPCEDISHEGNQT